MIAIISATFNEVEIFSREMDSKKNIKFEGLSAIEGKFLGENLVLIISGVGIKKAKNAASLAITKYKPKLILSAGFSGALNSDLEVGDIVMGSKVISLQKKESISLFCDIPYISFYYKKGELLSESRFIGSCREKEQLFEQSSALAVDMETWGVAEVARNHNLKAVSIRVISDDLEFSLPKMEKLFNKDSRLSASKSLKYFLKNPFHIVPFMKFKYINLRKAKIKLSHFLLIIIPLLRELDS